MNKFDIFLGYFILVVSMLIDPFIIFVIIYLLHVGLWFFGGIYLLLWFMCLDFKPFSAWKPSNIKSFLKNWKRIIESK